MANVPIVGFIRYSCRASFARSDFFHSEYLDYRLGIFKDVTLKSFQEQTDTDFVIFLLHSESLPQKYKDIFQELERNNAFLRAIYIPDSELEGDAYRSAVEGSKKHVKPLNGMSINFRIDNDDAVHSDFIARLKYFLKPVFYDNIISFPNISIVQRTGENKYLVQERYFPSNSIGLAYVTNIDNYKTIMTLGDHGKVNQKHNMVCLSGKGGLQTINGSNVMNSLYLGQVSALNKASLGIFLKENGYSDIDFRCLNVCKRMVVLDAIKKMIKFAKK